jgi:hypothetical protein
MQRIVRLGILWSALALPACGGGSGPMVEMDGSAGDAGTDTSTSTDNRPPDTKRDTSADHSGDSNTSEPDALPPDTGVSGDGNTPEPDALPPDTGLLAWGAFGPISAPTPVLVEIALTSVPETGGLTVDELNDLPDPYQKPTPRVPVIFRSGSYGTGASMPNGELKLRGASTRLADQKSYTIEIFETEPAFSGTRTIFLNKHPYDLTRLRNKLSFDLFAAIPEMKTLKTSFVHLTIDGQDYGLFTQVEHAGPRYLREQGFGDGGLLYKAKLFEFLDLPEFKLTTDPTYNKAEFETYLEIKGANNHARLLDMLTAVNNDDMPIDDVVARYFDRKNYITWLAVNLLTNNLDTTSQNFYLAARADSDTWTFVPWDYDGAWGFYQQPNEAGRALPRWRDGIANWWAATLHRRFLAVPANFDQFAERVDQLARDFFTTARLSALLESYKPVVRAALIKEPDLAYLPTRVSGTEAKEAAWEAEVDRLLTIVTARRDNLYELIERPMPFFLGTPLVGEGTVLFTWDPSEDLQADAITYDLEISTVPTFASLIFERKDYTSTLLRVEQELDAGKYFWRVIARDAKDPTVNWQLPFDNLWNEEDDTIYLGLGTFQVE